ncbi:alkene reductase [Edwardsiella tarda]|uniref:alkene reductase n=1 Tax=Edwardsiella tarda TaxID=636 RepID=UPI0030814085|nr:alkene reductase [Edwardsiella tarda]
MQNDTLFSPLRLGDLDLKNRIVLPPLTRCRSEQPGNIPGALMVEYYQQRVGAGLMITEGTQIEPRGQGYAWTPGIHSVAQIAGWRQVTERVHQQGGLIFCQLWHVGRVSHVALQPDGQPPVAPSALPATSVRVFIETAPGEGKLVPPSEPRELSTAEVKALVTLYKQAAINAKQAGFDGVEIHAANGYLINQFISEHTNQRRDEYGGSLNNRLRFLREIVQAVSEVYDSQRIGVRFSPLFSSTDEERVYLGLVEADPQATYIAAAQLLQDLRIGYLSIAEPDWQGSEGLPLTFRRALRKAFSAPIMYSGLYTADKARQMLASAVGDIFGFGRPFIANPDLPRRLAEDLPLNTLDATTLYGGGHKGYVDYPLYRDA